jgi:hypothetical protein
MNTYWNMYQLFNYMQTWSAVKKFNIEKKFRPVELSKRRYYKSMVGNIQRKISNMGNKSSSWHHTIRTNGIHR